MFSYIQSCFILYFSIYYDFILNLYLYFKHFFFFLCRENLNNRALIYQRALRKKERSPVGASPLESLVDIMQQDIIPMVCFSLSHIFKYTKIIVFFFFFFFS